MAITQQRHDVTVAFPNFERTSLIGDPTPSESVYDLPVFSYLIHDLARHFGDQRDQQRLWNVLKARLHDEFGRAASSKHVFPNGTWSTGSRRIAGIITYMKSS